MIKIDSSQNKTIKDISKLLKVKYRNKEGKYIIEGVRIIDSALNLGIDLEAYICTEEFANKDDSYKLIDRLEAEGVRGILTSEKIFLTLSSTVRPQGIIAICKMKNTLKLDQDPKAFVDYLNGQALARLKTGDEINTQDLSRSKTSDEISTLASYDDHNNDHDVEIKLRIRPVLVLDRIQDPGNMGTIIRTADAAGIKDIFIVKGSVDIYNDKVIRSAVGSIFSMNFYFASTEKIIEALKEASYDIVSSSLDTDQFYHKITYPQRVALVIGNEANGVSDEFISNSSMLVKIPIIGGAESLNASVSAGILIYELIR